MKEKQRTYHIYLLTVWHELTDGSQNWRYRLLDPETGLDLGFVTPQALPHALQQLQREADSAAASQ